MFPNESLIFFQQKKLYISRKLNPILYREFIIKLTNSFINQHVNDRKNKEGEKRVSGVISTLARKQTPAEGG